MDTNNIKIGYIDAPVQYLEFTSDEKIAMCDNLIDRMLVDFDKYLQPDIDRLDFLKQVLESSLITNEMQENWEICCIIRDCKKRLDEDRD